MEQTLLLAATCILAALGFGLIAVSQKQHRTRVRLPVARRRPATLRSMGYALIAGSVVPAVVRDGWAFGLLVWTTMLTVSALLVVAGLARLRVQPEDR